MLLKVSQSFICKKKSPEIQNQCRRVRCVRTQALSVEQLSGIWTTCRRDTSAQRTAELGAGTT